MAKILVVDDDEDCVELLAVHLQRRGHDVVAAKDGAAGLERAAWERPAAIVLDLRLPGVDGGRVAQILRANDLTRLTPLLLISAADKRWTMPRVPLGDPLTRFLEKPLDFERLDAVLRELLPAA